MGPQHESLPRSHALALATKHFETVMFLKKMFTCSILKSQVQSQRYLDAWVLNLQSWD